MVPASQGHIDQLMRAIVIRCLQRKESQILYVFTVNDARAFSLVSSKVTVATGQAGTANVLNLCSRRV